MDQTPIRLKPAEGREDAFNAAGLARLLDEAAPAEGEERYRHAFELSPQIPWIADAEGRVTEISRRWFELTGDEPEEDHADSWRTAIHPDDLPGLLTTIRSVVLNGGDYSAKYRVRIRGGAYRWMWSRARARRDGAGRVVSWYGSVEDIHDQVLAEEARAAGEERLRLAVRATGLGVADIDLIPERITWSPELRAVLGVDPDAVPAHALYLSLVHPDDRAGLAESYRAAIEGEEDRFHTSHRIRRADTGAERWVETHGRLHRDERGEPVRVLVTLQDVTESREAQERVLWAARHDGLTGLANRALFNERLAGFVARGQPFGLLLVDLDHLKQVNDSVGHDGGDAVLKGAAERLVAAAASPGDVARLGGDEFGIILPGVASRAALEEAAENLRGRLAQPLVVDGRALDTHASIGAALFPDHGRAAGLLMKSADVALYAVKSEGRGRAQLFDRRLRMGLARRAGMLRRAREALRHDRVEPHYQPKVDLATGRVVGFEALLRWRDAHGRLRGPAELQAAFEDWEVAAELSDRMLARVVADMGAWDATGVPFGRVAVNVSNAEFIRGDLPERVLERLGQATLPADRLELELTETVLLGQRAAEVGDTLRALAGAGVRVALDDFGTGFASLVHVRRFPIDVIKIDRSFTGGVDSDPGAAAIVRALVGLARDLGLETVAEGVETHAQLCWLRREGCTLGQGYLFGRAQPASFVPAMLAAGAGMLAAA